MVRPFIVLGLIMAIVIGSLAREAGESDDKVSDHANVSTGTIIAISIGTVVGGIGGFYLIRRIMKERAHADSVIAVVENAWRSAAVLYGQERYRDALLRLREITAIWYEYDKCISKYRHKNNVNPDTIRSVIASCDFLESMIEPVRLLSMHAETLPSDDYSLQKMSRYDLNTQRAFLKSKIDSIITANPNHRSGLLYSFRHITNRLQKVDSLLAASFSQQRADFTVKNRFYYNRANETGDTAALRRFVDDCNYFQVDKEWCHRARMVLSGKSPASQKGLFPPGKMTVQDSITYAFEKAIGSSKIEDLEAYIKKYSSQQYRKYSQLIKLNEITTALRMLKDRVGRKVAFDKKYPRFNNDNLHQITMTTKGLSKSTEEIFRLLWKQLEPDLARVSARFPAGLVLDYTHEPPILVIDAVIDPASDVTTTNINERSTYRIECLIPFVDILYRLKKGVILRLKKKTVGLPDGDVVNYRDVVNYEIKKVNFAAYVIRLQKADNRGMMIFYAKDTHDQSDTSRLVEFYDFYDMTVTSYKQHRFTIYPTSIPNIIPSISNDSLERTMGNIFFESTEED